MAGVLTVVLVHQEGAFGDLLDTADEGNRLADEMRHVGGTDERMGLSVDGLDFLAHLCCAVMW